MGNCSSPAISSLSFFWRKNEDKRLVQDIPNSSSKPQNLTDGARQLAPFFFLFGELPSPGCSEPVVFRFSIILRELPFRADPARLLDAVESGIERPFFHAKRIAGNLLDVDRDAVAVHGPVR